MHTEESRQLVQRLWAAFSTREQDKIAAFFVDDAEWIAPKANATAVALGVTDHMKGPAEIAAFVAHGMQRLYNDVAIKFLGFYADGRFVIVEEEMTATLPNMPPEVRNA